MAGCGHGRRHNARAYTLCRALELNKPVDEREQVNDPVRVWNDEWQHFDTYQTIADNNTLTMIKQSL